MLALWLWAGLTETLITRQHGDPRYLDGLTSACCGFESIEGVGLGVQYLKIERSMI